MALPSAVYEGIWKEFFPVILKHYPLIAKHLPRKPKKRKPDRSVKPELRVTCSTFRIAAVVQKAGAIQNSADARQEYCS